ncbi:MAG: AAA family ATPase [Magnetococcales bacterium]|nr:AAA family ATPase [Magnetococcales bacterium]MBF0114012.1 AAA family ATPase [Magnetococcales bacterium]
MRITRLTLKNFKSIKEQVYDFGPFELLVGRNNSGKSSVLQALAIWQFCVDLFHQSERGGSRGIQVVLPNFTALPLPEFNLLWKDRTDRVWPDVDGKKKQEFVQIQILVRWQYEDGTEKEFGVNLRYQSPQTLYAIPSGGWDKLRECETGGMPKIVYIPPFSGLEPAEKRLDVAPIRQQVGKGQPGSVLRNLLLSVCARPADLAGKERTSKRLSPTREWQELARMIQQWFSVELHEPLYDPTRDVFIRVEYKQNGKNYDVIAAGSGFHQTLTLLAFLYGYRPTTMLIDEPDAHLHANLQRELLDYFKQKSNETGMQCLIATHAEEFLRGVDASQIVSLLDQVPRRINSTPHITRALADVSNEEIDRLRQFPCIVYVEGASDERILRAWAKQCAAQNILGKVFFKKMGGGNKSEMKEMADRHFDALHQIIPEVSRVVLFDYDSHDGFHPDKENPVLAEWRRKNIENYLLVPSAWRRAVTKKMGPLLATPLLPLVEQFFAEQNLNLPPNQTWRGVTADWFRVVDGKRILFENDDSLFHRLRNTHSETILLREEVALSMEADEIHEDVHHFIARLAKLHGSA